jgi:ABC-type antimicrobial peptide transport system permease subunit
MIKNFISIAVRNLLRHKSYSFINIVGLTLGITCALFIFLIVRFELSYDRYHAKADRIFRINTGGPGEERYHDMGTPTGLAPALRSEFFEMEEVAAILKLNPDRTQIRINDELTRITETYLVQPEFFNIFDFNWKQGDPKTSLDNPNEVVIAESLANRFFQGKALGKSIRLNNNEELIVTGIIQDPPVNSDFPIQMAVSHATLEKNKNNFDPNNLDGWNSYYHTYVILKKGVDPETLGPKLKSLVERRIGKEQAEKYLAFSIMPLRDIHFISDNFNKRTISPQAISTLRIIGIFILFIACINFINLASAQAVRRSKEVGIRKTLGSSRKNLIFQFLGEAFIVTLVAMLLSFVLVSQLTVMSKSLTDIPLSPETMMEPGTLSLMLIIVIAVTLLSGFYPAFVLSGFKPVAALKNATTSMGARGIFVRKGLIAFQFIITQVLIICTLITIKQTAYFETRPLGFTKEAVLTADLPTSDQSVLTTLRNGLLQYPEIKNVSFSLNTPSATINKWWTDFKHQSMADEKSLELKFVDSTYLKMFEIETVAGISTIEGDSGLNVIVNESLVKEIGFDKPEKALGEILQYSGKRATIVGVVRDFQTVTLHEGVHPVLITRQAGNFQKVSVQIDMNHTDKAIRHLEKHWKAAFPEFYFEYDFLDQQLATFYKEEKKISRLLVAFASVAIGIGCIGLLGLIMFVSAQRTKEVGIRKILGASLGNIAMLLSRDFIILVFIAGLIACPIGYYFMDKWLENFVNHIPLADNLGVFVASTVLALLLAAVTVGTQSIKAALANPTDSLRAD